MNENKMSAAVLFFLSFLLLQGQANAAGLVQSPNQCAMLFQTRAPMGKIEINAVSEPDRGARIKADAEIIARVAHDLGLSVPDHQLNIVPSVQLGIMASTGGHPAPHWHDGFELVRSQGSARGVLEFVTKGCPTCRAYYSASTPHVEQREVVVHVAGHNDMSQTSVYQRIRPGDSQLASYQRALVIGKAYRQNNHAQVAMFYQFLKSLDSLQDYSNGSFEDPSKFSPENSGAVVRPAEARGFWEAPALHTGGFFENLVKRDNTRAVQGPEGWVETYSVLQALTNMLPPDAPEWQHAILKLEEQSVRMFPAISMTQIMNEGWATLMMYVVARHLPWTTSADLVTYGQLLSGVTRPSFQNPYWIGVSGWRNLYEQFRERPEIRSLSEFEKDKAFIAWARPFYAPKNDSQWVKIALDQRWIEKHRFFLHRPTQEHEMDPKADPKKQGHIAVSRDWKRIQNFIISQYVDNKRRRFPSLKIRNPNHTPGKILLVQDTSEKIPLDLVSAAKTLFVLAQVVRKPSEVEAIFPVELLEQTEFGQKNKDNPAWADGVVSGRLNVTVNGKVKLEFENYQADGFASQLERIIDDYKEDVVGSYTDDFSDYQMHQWTKLTAKVSDAVGAPANEMVSHAPHTGAAVREYLNVIEHRLYKAMQDVLNGRKKAKVTARGVKLSILPEIPKFRYAFHTLENRIAKRPPAPIDYPGSQLTRDFHVDENGTTIGVGSVMPGDKWGDPPPKEEGGEGEGGGQGQNPPEEIEEQEVLVPLGLWGEMLRGVIKLPNVRDTEGKLKKPKSIRSGAVTKTSGNILWGETAINGAHKANALRKAKGQPYGSQVPFTTLIQEGLRLLEPADYRVSGRVTRPRPAFSAVMFVKIDLTGSMQGERMEAAKNLVYNMKAILEAEYGPGNVELVYIGFNDKAKELTEEQAFKVFFSGSTSYASASKKVKEILDNGRYPRAKYNRYDLTIGDAETFGSDASENLEAMNQLKPELQHAALVVTNDDMRGTHDLVSSYQSLRDEWPHVGITQLIPGGNDLQSLKEAFAVEDEK